MALHFFGILMGSGRSAWGTCSSASGVESCQAVHNWTSSWESSDGMVSCTLLTLLMMWFLSNRSAPGSPCFLGAGLPCSSSSSSSSSSLESAARPSAARRHTSTCPYLAAIGRRRPHAGDRQGGLRCCMLAQILQWCSVGYDGTIVQTIVGCN